ncbi:MAG TPA: hypothetical protein DHW45_14880, partial [Candidatus Latescibacteria bacterium]|nr:hypothetical protein [Candidatus Latescibacterota bacterium]
RCKRIVRELGPLALTASSDTEASTRNLLQAYESAKASIGDNPGISGLLSAISELEAPINRFFDEVLVMAEKEDLKDARLSLLQHIADLPAGIANLSRLEGF